MKSTTLVCAITVATLGFGSLSFAQGYEQRGPGGGQAQHYDQRAPMNRPGYGPGPRHFDHRDARYDRPMGARGPQFYRGGHIPMQYRNQRYMVNNWRGHHLSPPPRGQAWVQVGADYALIAIATGVIAQLVLSR
ncbi:regulator RcnB of Ni and Co efflux [Polaromonas sp. OV174]|uniref:RcnB family protein n=1 Tax=Polaromonas sp. OV174 TaxID=1855300 RepID=UPI0008E0C45A|nr:RcnB family protein [Polaromonas sp. OV174]SFC49568.1 regulator RcnB of Ni and Co efflux [Polaromonas sp. OV174]